MQRYDMPPTDGFHRDLGVLLASLNDSTREWRENLEQPSVEAITYQPWPDSYSIGALILHIIDSELYWFETFVGGIAREEADSVLLMSEEVQQYGGKWPVPPAEPIEWYFELQERYRIRAIEALRNQDPDRIIPRKTAEFSVRWVVAHVVEHDSYHGGQAVLLHEMWKRVGRSSGGG